MPTSDSVPDGLRKRLSRARFCETCQTIKADGPSHASRLKHPFRALTTAEIESESERWRLAQAGHKGAQQHHIQQRQVVQSEAWAKQSQPVANVKHDYIYDFGKHKGKTLLQVRSLDKGYAAWCMVSGMHVQRPTWKTAMMEANLWDIVQKEAQELRLAKKAASKAHPGPENEHPEVRRLHALQASARDDDVPLFQESLPSRKRLRTGSKKSKAMVQIHNCSLCGRTDHKRHTCPQRASLAEVHSEEQLVKSAHLAAQKKARVVSRLKYTALHQRSLLYETRPTQRVRAGLARSLLELATMTPLNLLMRWRQMASCRATLAVRVQT